MELSTEKQGVYTTVSIDDNRIDVQNATQIRTYLLNLIAEGNQNIVVDLRHVTFIDSSGLGALVYALREAKMNGGDVKVSHLKSQVQSMFKVTRLNKIFNIIDLPED